MGSDGIGARVRQAVGAERSHSAVAEAIGMSKDAFSRSINGKRAFTSTELALVADLLDADIRWLIVGEPDPLRRRVVARHHFDHETGERTVPGRKADEEVLGYVELAYRQAYPRAEDPAVRLPMTAAGTRAVLGDDFVRDFADRVERALGVDVIRVPGLTTDYSVVLGGRAVIVLEANGNWFRSNWSLAHELGHIALMHHGAADAHTAEPAANAFAAELLMPGDAMHAVDWSALDVRGLALLLWRWGVSADAVKTRLRGLGIEVPGAVETILRQSTQRILRRGLAFGESVRGGNDELTQRMRSAAARRFPGSLLEAHVGRIESGAITSGTLAWMLDMPQEDLVVDSPDPPGADVGGLAEMLGY